jgi:hypothetical protein
MAAPPHSELELDTYLVSRLAELQDEAKEENLSISEKSKADLIKFTQDNTNIKRPHIFLVENGNFRAVWKNDKDEQVGIQFLGDDVGQFVIFVARNDANFVARSCGRDSLANSRLA